MRTFITFVLLIAAAFAAMALLTWPAWLVLYPAVDAPFHRIGNRVAMLAFIVGFVLLARRLALADRASLGYGVPRRIFARELALGFGLGALSMLAVVALMLAFGLRVPKPDTALDAAAIAAAAGGTLAGAFAVALIEETFLRGAMHSGMRREMGAPATIVLISLVYAALHFLARTRIPHAAVDAGSGFALLGATLQAFGDPAAIADAYLSLFAVGVVLGLVREATDHIAACMGLHAGWVWIMLITRELSAPNDASAWRALLSAHDGFVGWLVLIWTLPLGLALWVFYRRRGAAIRAAE